MDTSNANCMKTEDWKKIAKWIGIAYLPVAILVIVVFLIIQWQMRKIDAVRPAGDQPAAPSSTQAGSTTE